MPIYEYECPKCGDFEVSQRITEEPLKKCPHCRSKVRKLISNTSFQLKGSGWYITDYAKKETPAAKSGDAPQSDQAAKTDSKTTPSGEAASGGGEKAPSTAAAPTAPSSGTTSQKTS